MNQAQELLFRNGPFGKETSVKLFREVKSVPVRYHKKVHWFFSHVCNPKFAAIQCFAAGQHVNRCFFAIICIFYCPALITGTSIIGSLRLQSRLQQEFNVCVPLRKKRHCCLVFLLLTFFRLGAPQLIGQFSVQNDLRRKHPSNTGSYSISIRGKQLYIFCHYRHIKRICQFSVPVETIILCQAALCS